jgi:hypothetical protein
MALRAEQMTFVHTGARWLMLAAIVVTAVFFSSQAEKVAEVEPFKTSITLIFMRSAPFMLYAVALLIAGMFHYKFFAAISVRSARRTPRSVSCAAGSGFRAARNAVRTARCAG